MRTPPSAVVFLTYSTGHRLPPLRHTRWLSSASPAADVVRLHAPPSFCGARPSLPRRQRSYAGMWRPSQLRCSASSPGGPLHLPPLSHCSGQAPLPRPADVVRPHLPPLPHCRGQARFPGRQTSCARTCRTPALQRSSSASQAGGRGALACAAPSGSALAGPSFQAADVADEHLTPRLVLVASPSPELSGNKRPGRILYTKGSGDGLGRTRSGSPSRSRGNQRRYGR
jgi:hypothetical protein